MDAHTRGRRLLSVLLAAAIVSTALHYTSNYLSTDRYPQPAWLPLSATRVAILVSWPLLTAIGLLGYRCFRRRAYGTAGVCLVIYSFTGLVTLAHFLNGTPNVPPGWFATIFTDGATGLAVLTFAVWTLLRLTPDPVPRLERQPPA